MPHQHVRWSRIGTMMPLGHTKYDVEKVLVPQTGSRGATTFRAWPRVVPIGNMFVVEPDSDDSADLMGCYSTARSAISPNGVLFFSTRPADADPKKEWLYEYRRGLQFHDGSMRAIGRQTPFGTNGCGDVRHCRLAAVAADHRVVVWDKDRIWFP